MIGAEEPAAAQGPAGRGDDSADEIRRARAARDARRRWPAAGGEGEGGNGPDSALAGSAFFAIASSHLLALLCIISPCRRPWRRAGGLPSGSWPSAAAARAAHSGQWGSGIGP
jgi:hypothetical protein